MTRSALFTPPDRSLYVAPRAVAIDVSAVRVMAAMSVFDSDSGRETTIDDPDEIEAKGWRSFSLWDDD